MSLQIQSTRAAAALLLALAAFHSFAGAQSPGQTPTTLTANGPYELKLAPQKLRLTLSIRAEGTDAKAAVEAYVKHVERVKKELVEMKADAASLEISPPQFKPSGSDTHMNQTIFLSPTVAVPNYGISPLQAPPAAAAATAAKPPKILVATGYATAEWALPTTDVNALAILPESLKEQIEARDLLGTKNKAKLDAAQQEKREEQQASGQGSFAYSTTVSSTSDEPPSYTVMFVAKIDEESRKKATKAAYDAAVAEAKLLADASGHKLGELKSINCTISPSDGTGESRSPFVVTFPDRGIPKTDTALNSTPNGLSVIVGVNAEFTLTK